MNATRRLAGWGRRTVPTVLWLGLVAAVASLAAPTCLAQGVEQKSSRIATLATASGQDVASDGDDLRKKLIAEFEERMAKLRADMLRQVESTLAESDRQREQSEAKLAEARARIAQLEAEAEKMRQVIEALEARLAAHGGAGAGGAVVIAEEPAGGAQGRPFLGVGLAAVSEEKAKRLSLAEGVGIEVTFVVPDSPAQAVGMKVGDVITGVGERKGVDRDGFLEVMSDKKPGQRVAIAYTRLVDGAAVRFDARVRLADRGKFDLPGAEAPPPPQPISPQPPKPAEAVGGAPVRLGVRVVTTDGQLEVTQVVAGSNAAVAGMQAGDRLLRIAGKQVRSTDQVRELLSTIRSGQTKNIVYRRGESRFVARLRWGGGDVEAKLVSLETRKGKVRSKEPRAAKKAVPATPIIPGAVARKVAEKEASKKAAESAGGAKKRGYLGVELEEGESGLVVREVIAGSAAERMGLKSGDLLTRFNDLEPKKLADLRRLFRSMHAGDKVTVTVLRKGVRYTIRGQLGSAGKSPAPSREGAPRPVTAEQGAAGPVAAVGRMRPRLGLTAYAEEGSVIVDEVEPDSVAADGDIRSADRILSVEGRHVRTLVDVRDALAGAVDPVEITIDRGGRRIRLELRMTTPTEPRPYIGVEVEESDGPRRLLVTDVIAGSAADLGGVRVGDELIALDGQVVESLESIRRVLDEKVPGAPLSAQVLRGGLRIELDITVGAR